jgi:(p)ppGpp synthase/HD superfamily hydrolase
MTAEDSSLVARARELAVRAHAGQRYGQHGYVVHLQAVHDVLVRFGISDENVLAASWLHDVLEDNPRIHRADLERSFPEAVVVLADACTDGPGATREERKQRPLALIPQTPNAVLVKLADRIANVEASLRDSDAARLSMYRGEQASFAAALRDSPASPSAEPMWTLLEQLLR